MARRMIMEKNIKEFVEHLPEKKDSKKIISLYTLIKKNAQIP